MSSRAADAATGVWKAKTRKTLVSYSIYIFIDLLYSKLRTNADEDGSNGEIMVSEVTTVGTHFSGFLRVYECIYLLVDGDGRCDERQKYIVVWKDARPATVEKKEWTKELTAADTEVGIRSVDVLEAVHVIPYT